MDQALNPLLPRPAWPIPAGRAGTRPATRPPVPSTGARDAAENELLASLIGAVAAGDRKALERLYAGSVARVYPLALRITRRQPLAEEVIEDVYVQVWHTARHFDASRGSPLAWLLTICRSRALDALRRMDPAILVADPGEWLDAWTDGAATPEDPVDTARDRAALHRALAALAPSQRQLVGLAFFRGLTHAELARHLDLPLGTVKSRMRQALGELRQALGGR